MSKLAKGKTALIGICLIIALVFVWAFMPSESPVDYLNRVDQSVGTYVQSKTFGDLEVAMKYKPPAYMAASQCVKSRGENTATYQDLVSDFASTSNYQLRLENKKGTALVKGITNAQNDYQELVYYLSFGIQQDLKLCTQTDTLSCAFVHFERNYDLAPFTNITFGFDTEHLEQPLMEGEDWSILFNADHFNLGPMFFRFDPKKLQENPKFNF